MIGEITVAGTLTGEFANGVTWVALFDGESALAADDGDILITDGIGVIADSIEGGLSAVQGLSGEITTAEQVVHPTYTGEYEITPTQQTQTIPINGLLAADDITVNPIPSNYGLITWDGSTLTVS